MNTRITRPLVESALLAALGAAMILLAWYVPVIGVVLAFVSPLPIAVTVIRHGVRWGVLSSVVTAFIIALFAGWVTAVTLWVVNGAMGISFGFAVRRRYRPTIVLSLACVGTLFASIAEYALAYLFAGLTITQQVDELLLMIQRSLQMAQNFGGQNPLIDQLTAFMTREQFFRVMPALLILSALLLAYLNFEIFRHILPRLGYSLEGLPPFSRWIFPEITAHTAILSDLLTATRPVYNIPAVARAAENIFAVASLFLTIEAIAVAAFFMLRSGVSRGMTGLFLVIGGSLTMGDPVLGLLITLFGMIDVLFDFRHIRFEPIDEL